MRPTSETRGLMKVRAELARLSEAMREMERRHAREVQAAHPCHRAGARNLLHYLALRQRDLRPLQKSLSGLGLSSLGRGEPGALGNVETVLRTVERLLGREGEVKRSSATVRGVGPEEGRRLLERHTRALLGPPSPGRRVRIMVTIPGDAVEDEGLMRGLIARGMNIMRINCAREGPEVWAGIIRNLRSVKGGKRCRVFMDLSGPKPRTGPIAPGPAVVSWRPERDEFGKVVSNARVLLTGRSGALPVVPGASAVVPVDGEWLARRKGGEKVRFRDARRSARTLRIIRPAREGVWAESARRAYVTPGTTFTVTGRDGIRDRTVVREFTVEQGIVLKGGERMLLTRRSLPGEPAPTVGGERIAHIGVTLPGVLDRVRKGDRVWFDDGKIGGLVRRKGRDGVEVEITSTRERGRKLSSGRSINLPDTPPWPMSFAPSDAAALAFAARHADMVGLSFVRGASDIRLLQSKLAAHRGGGVGVVVKIENLSAFEHLPELLLAAMRSPVAGVLIARGDLAVECGYEPLAEIQEETLWFCEAAHLPVFWATQVLEKLARSGMPSRAEITDAAASGRAECVMLNKGPHIFAALETLDGILRRMQSHATKKRPHLRPLAIAKREFRLT